MDPCGSIWAHMGPYGSICAHMDPIWVHMDYKICQIALRRLEISVAGGLTPVDSSVMLRPYGLDMGPYGSIWITRSVRVDLGTLSGSHFEDLLEMILQLWMRTWELDWETLF